MSENEPRRLSTRQILSQFPKALRWVWEADPRSTVLLCLVTVTLGLLPAGMAWVGRLIIDGVVQAAKTSDPHDRQLALMALAVELALSVVTITCRRLQTYLREVLRVSLGNLFNTRILEKALQLELAAFENAATYDLLQNARGEASNRPLSLTFSTLTLIKSLLTLSGFAVLLWGLAWWSVVLLAVASVPEFLAETRLSGDAFRLYSWRAKESRMLTYLEWMLTRDTHVKEVKLYGLGPLVLQRSQKLFAKFVGEDRALARRKLGLGSLFAALSSIAFYVCYAAVGWRAAMGLITVGDLTLSIVAFRQGQGAFEDVLSSVAGMYEDALYVSNLSRYFELPATVVSAIVTPAKVLPPGRFSIELDHVSFTYPGSARPAIRDVSLTIGPGEKLAVVGENGAGKSTLIKLLLRLYEPTSGVIRFGGIDIRELDVTELRARVAAVFQDFVRYQFTASENIGLGDLSRLEAGPAIAQAAVDGGAAEVIEGLPQGAGTMLGTWFEDAQELSGGQWQKLAIARSFMRLTSRGGEGADLLILDEPTAAIDAAAEFALFERFQKLTVGRSAIIISHRFSTVRIADRIAVIENGALLELGSHEQLLAQHGRYAHLFTLQAQGYR
jgi:ABC-type multidrug transport system fused ATPase/permease subunit